MPLFSLLPFLRAQKLVIGGVRMFILGLTGSIGMGKTTTARLFAEAGVPVHDSDAAVHRLYEGEAVAAIERLFPARRPAERSIARSSRPGSSTTRRAQAAGGHRASLGAAVRNEVPGSGRARGESIVVLDIPLLYETGGEKRVDAVVVVTAPADIQRKRVMERPGMTPDKFAGPAGEAGSRCGEARARRFHRG